MRTLLTTSVILVGALLLPVTGYTTDYDTDRSSPKAFVKDTVIKRSYGDLS